MIGSAGAVECFILSPMEHWAARFVSELQCGLSGVTHRVVFKRKWYLAALHCPDPWVISAECTWSFTPVNYVKIYSIYMHVCVCVLCALIYTPRRMCVCICACAPGCIMMCGFHVCVAFVNYESKGCMAEWVPVSAVPPPFTYPLLYTHTHTHSLQTPQHLSTQPWLLNDCHPSRCHVIN